MIAELQRVLKVPRKKYGPEHYGPGRIDLTPVFALVPGVQLYPVQSQALAEAHFARGLCGSIGVGHGKTLISFLVGQAMGAHRVLLLVPSAVRPQTLRMLGEARQSWRVSPNIEVLGYGKLSETYGEELLWELNPDLIVADEAHYLKHRTSARTKRVLRWFLAKAKRCGFVALSGTLLASGVQSMVHLSEWSLRSRMPLPRDKYVLETWARVLDPGGVMEPGDGAVMIPLLNAFPAEGPRESFRLRCTSVMGFVATSDSGVKASLREVPLRLPDGVEKVRTQIASMEASSQLPNGTYFTSPVEAWRAKMQMSLGWYYHWVWDDAPDYEWVAARNTWAREAYWYLFGHGRRGCDTAELLGQQLDKGPVGRPGLEQAWVAWKAVRHRKGPRTVPTVLFPEVLESIVRNSRHPSEPTLYWYLSDAVASMLERLMPVNRAGEMPPKGLVDQAVSMRAHGTGVETLTPFRRSVILEASPSALLYEQVIGRTHRSSQKADTVYYSIVQHTEVFRAAVQAAKKQAHRIGRLAGQIQRLVYADQAEECDDE